MIKVLIVDDSKIARYALRKALERDPEILVIEEAETGEQAIRLANKYDPDLVTMDVYLAEENGLKVTAKMMKESPRPILVVTGISPSDPELIYQALEKGALDVFPKLPAPESEDYEKMCGMLIRRIKLYSSVPVLHSSRKQSNQASPVSLTKEKISHTGSERKFTEKVDVILIGASTGGPPTIASILKGIPSPVPVPVVVVQHISEGFSKSFTDWLGQATGHKTLLVERSMKTEPGTVYIAPDNSNIAFALSNVIMPVKREGYKNIVPSIDVLFKSAVDFFGTHAAAILLTGMGKRWRARDESPL